MSSIQTKIVDAVLEGNEELIRDSVRELSYIKTRKLLGLLESNEITIRGNDIFVGGNTVGSFVTKDDKIEFTSAADGTIHTFENDEELMDYVSSLTEEVEAPVGYTKHELASYHKDPRMENPKKNYHRHDDPSGDKEPTGKSKPASKIYDHNPNGKGHRHDDPSGYKEPTGKSKSAPKVYDHKLDGKGHKHDDPSGVGKVKDK